MRTELAKLAPTLPRVDKLHSLITKAATAAEDRATACTLLWKRSSDTAQRLILNTAVSTAVESEIEKVTRIIRAVTKRIVVALYKVRQGVLSATVPKKPRNKTPIATSFHNLEQHGR
jgi:hypothetical protein